MGTRRRRPRDYPEDYVVQVAHETRGEDPDVAIGWLADYLEAHPTSVRARLLLGAFFADDYGDGVAGAEKVFREVLAFDPDNVVAMVRLALLQGHPHSSLTVDESLELLERAATSSKDPYILRNYAHKAWETGQLERAAAAFVQLRETATGPSAAFFNRVADEALEAIHRGEEPSTSAYWYPDIT